MTGTPLDVRDACGLRAFSGPGRAHENEIHVAFISVAGSGDRAECRGMVMSAEHLVKRAQKGTETARVY